MAAAFPLADAAAPAASWRRLALLLAAAQCLALVLLGVMLLNKHRHLLTELTLSRLEIQAGDLESALHIGVMTGLRPDEIHRLGPMVEGLAQDRAIAGIEVFAAEGSLARVAFAADPARRGAALGERDWQALAKVRGFRRVQTPTGPVLETSIRGPDDEAVGGLRVAAATAPLAAQQAAMERALWPRLALALAATAAATLAGLFALRRRGGSAAGIRRRVMAVAVTTTLAAGSGVAWHAHEIFSAGLAPAVDAKVQGVAAFLGAKIAHAADLGIPLDRLPGVAEYFAGLMGLHPEIAALRLTDGTGRVLAEHRGSAAAAPWIEMAAGPGRVAVAADDGFVARRLGELSADIAIVLLVAILVFRELLAALLGALPGTTEDQPAASLRLPLFLFILTEEMSRSFLPLYVKGFAGTEAPFTPETQIGLPIALYMFCFALATPFAGRWADRWGVARVFAAGVALSAVGFAWTALATGYWQLLPARALCAWGYATGTMACQRQLIVLAEPSQRARALALFVGAVGIAAVCGSSLGGVLADQLGFRPVFVISALLALAAYAVFRAGGAAAAGHGDAGPPLRLAEVRRLFADRRFSALMLGSAIPAKLALAGFLFYLAPLALHAQGYGPAAIGRAVMLYFVLVAAVNPFASRLSDRYGWRLAPTVAGGLLIGLGGLAGLMGGDLAVWLGIAALGLGTGLATAPMQALASEIGAAAGASSVAVVLRTLERLGSVIGPLWVGAWLAATAWDGAMVATGMAVLAGTLLCLAAGRRRTA